MEYFGLIAFILVLAYSNYPDKIKKLEKQLMLLKRNIKGENNLSKLITDLKGQKCLVECEYPLAEVGKANIECDVLDTDDEWIKINFRDRKGIGKTKIIRIENIKSIELKK